MKKYYDVWICAIVLVLSIMFLLYFAFKPKQVVTASVDEPVLMPFEVSIEEEPEVLPVVFTNYYSGDATGSTKCTGAVDSLGNRMCTNMFKVNEQGWYTYDGHVVVATATTHCLKSNKFGCEYYDSVPEGIPVFKYWDTFRFEYEGRYYDAVVLDSCGACHVYNKSDKGLPRMDIYISSKKHSFSKIKASIIAGF